MFYLQHGRTETDDRICFDGDRVFIDDHIHTGCKVERAIEAADWLAAAQIVHDYEAVL